MAHFYGVLRGVRGARGEASRLGSKASGLRVTAASWQGAVDIELSERDGKDWAVVRLIPWQGKGVNRVLYDGPADGSGLEAKS